MLAIFFFNCYSIAMNFIEFNDVSFTYPAVEGDLDADGKPIEPRAVFEHFTAQFPSGFISLVGPNGSGKSTFMLLASGRLVPTTGKVLMMGKDIAMMTGEAKNMRASVIYQNMEFETEDKVRDLLTQVYQSGTLQGKASGILGNDDLLKEVIEVFELEGVLDHTLTGISKGEIQRTLLAFSILYGSTSVFMDEPLFAMEYPQKEKALSYLRDYCKKTGTTIYISMHELDLTKRFAEKVLLFYPNRDMSFGTPDEVLTDEDLEKAYGLPVEMLKKGEEYTRRDLTDTAKSIADMNLLLKQQQAEPVS